MTSHDPADRARKRLADAVVSTGRGDQDGLRFIYDATSLKLLGICLPILRDRAVAEDVLQEVYLKIWRGAAAFDPARASPITWMCTIARNTAIDWQRAAHRRVEHPTHAIEALPDQDEDPASELARRTRMNDCLGEIDERQRSAICAAFFEGFTYRELAERAAVPLGTMKGWVRRGLDRLRECLDGE